MDNHFKIYFCLIFSFFTSFHALADGPKTEMPREPSMFSSNPAEAEYAYRLFLHQQRQEEAEAFERGYREDARMSVFFPSAILGGVGALVTGPLWLEHIVPSSEIAGAGFPLVMGAAVVGFGTGVIGYTATACVQALRRIGTRNHKSD